MMRDQLAWTALATKLQGPGLCAFPARTDEIQQSPLSAVAASATWREKWSTKRSWRGRKANSSRRRDRKLRRWSPTCRSDVGCFHRLVRRAARERTGPGRSAVSLARHRRHARTDCVVHLTQEVAGEAGFDDLLALTQIKMSERAKLEMARNFWDEMGRGASKGMHGPMLERLAQSSRYQPGAGSVVPEALALGQHDDWPSRAIAATRFSRSARSASSR